MNSERAEDNAFSARFCFGTDIAIRLLLTQKKEKNMIVRIGCTYSYDMDFNDYMFEQRLRTMGEL